RLSRGQLRHARHPERRPRRRESRRGSGSEEVITPDERQKLDEKVRALSIGQIKRHIFLCAEQTKPKCSPHEVNGPAWDYLKRRLIELGLMKGPNCIFRTKANCLKVCEKGPIAVVYPE